ncbi:Deoxyadenosine/deoxycytidine kinase [Granulicatella balaenopterae]|uniref:Deoxyadenosine/deoxycytidine kinase n=1 Tax=Granulicatella balaenopterae TaxID=137733 RepID=A0A1H9P001_9LACT|nr:deoxynucleoside kinase [Granulicatella balaenopterae]SER41245.1 Deoxyadenosine/deoxycytidine kinase [Granulicatella balaenopterae]
MEGDRQAVIVLAGMIGAGKSTYTEMIAKELGSTPFFESVDDNRILEMFYDDPKRWAFALQIHFLNTRFRSIKDALQDRNNVLDRSIYEDALFTKINYETGNMSDAEMDTYLSLLDNMMEELAGMPKKAPDLLIYLRGPLEIHLDRIKKRGRDYEQITEENQELLDYYKHLHSRYDDWFNEYDKSETLVLQIDELDLEREEDRVEVMRRIREKLDELGNE